MIGNFLNSHTIKFLIQQNWIRLVVYSSASTLLLLISSNFSAYSDMAALRPHGCWNYSWTGSAILLNMIL